MASSPYFGFEQDFVGSLRCIPMVVRQKLDTCGIKLKLEHWNQFSQDERQTLVDMACDSPEAVAQYRDDLQACVAHYTGAPAKTLDIPDPLPWSQDSAVPEAVAAKFQAHSIPFDLHKWKRLSDAQRFALIKLSRPSHENQNFLPAVEEFGLLPSEPSS